MVQRKSVNGGDDFEGVWNFVLSDSNVSFTYGANGIGMLRDRFQTAVRQAKFMRAGEAPRRYLNDDAAAYFLKKLAEESAHALMLGIRSLEQGLLLGMWPQDATSKLQLIEKYRNRLKTQSFIDAQAKENECRPKRKPLLDASGSQYSFVDLPRQTSRAERFAEAHWVAIWQWALENQPPKNLAAEAKSLANQLHMNAAQASICLTQIRKMQSGSRFTSFTNTAATRFFLEGFAGCGYDYLAKALYSLSLAVDYANSNGQPVRDLVRLHVEFSERLAAMDEARFVSDEFDRTVKVSATFSQGELESRIAEHPAKPERCAVMTWVYDRDPNVVAFTLARAKGVCEKCKRAAPFRRATTDEGYLEVHHIQRLSDGGDDKPSNTLALCPNCHRELHYGVAKVSTSAL